MYLITNTSYKIFMKNFKKLQISSKLNLIAITYSILTIWLGDYIFSILTDTNYSFIDEFVPRIMQTILIYVPFGLLLLFIKNRLKNINSKNAFLVLIASCVTGFIASIVLWGYYFYDGYTYQIYNKTGGANIGLGMLLVFSPILISALMFIVYYISSKYIFKEITTY